MEFPGSLDSLWDLSQTPSQFSRLPDDDFLALLQKQYQNSIAPTNGSSQHEPSVNPQTIQNLSLPGLSPSSDDSSPSPPSNNDSQSRRQSIYSRGNNDNEESGLKRKASDDTMDEGPSSKNAHTADDSSSGRKGPSRRKSTGNGHDETRLLKRKEQNRAAQRAFRERKEKHVKDLEDKVAALESKNEEAQVENTNLRDLLARLQQENLALKEAQFTFSVPKPADTTTLPQPSSSGSSSNIPNNSFTFFGSSSTTSPPAGVSSPKPPGFGDIDWSALTTFDPSVLTALDETPNDAPMQMDQSTSPYGQYALPPKTQYKTIATNPLFMSFADSPDGTSTSNSNNDMNIFNFNFSSPQITPWSSQSSDFNQPSHQTTEFLQHNPHLDELFGGNFMGNQGPLDFSVLMKSPVAGGLSPVSHANGHSPQLPHLHNSISSPHNSIPSSQKNMTSPQNSLSPPSSASTSNGQSPFSWTMSRSEESPPSASESSERPWTCINRAQAERYITESGESPFTRDNAAPALRKTSDFQGNIVACEGANFPRTEQRPENVEVLKAWRTITSNPHFKDANINELCAEFTKKARCDGTKVVLEPQGVHHILERFGVKRMQPQEQQQQNTN
ncbi:hypothetical protein BJ138DRAFT_1128641 [Hygrophoropsis aurantiaca]|uniref:Uncharacterized protein n=1 Tax=Hygrophoropsis aurantiaca TaxID=72124 RepID=A0ACB8A654_9AGAM|nr:hypothetical protein BJ138DRAFT_1128641 [Hygrophoropsis aurantiaca]